MPPLFVQPRTVSQPDGHVLVGHEAPALQVASQLHEVPQSNPAPHAPNPPQSIMHGPGPHVIAPVHELSPEHEMSQFCLQVTAPAHVFVLVHSTVQVNALPQSSV